MDTCMTLKSCDFSAADEEWQLHFGSFEDMKTVMAAHCLDLNRVVLYTLGGHYLSRTTYIAHRVTLVFKTGALVGFAIINFQTFELPTYVDLWSGNERLSTKSPSFHDVQNKIHAPKKTYTVMHVAAIGCSPYATRGLGKRIIDFQKAIACASKVSLIALEAIKPLDIEYYSRHGFQTTSPSFYPNTAASNLVPMFYKVHPNDASSQVDLAFLNGPLYHRDPFNAADRAESENLEDCLWAPDDPRQIILDNYASLAYKIVYYLWQVRDNEEAKECLRQLSVRAELKIDEIKKLWSMRFHSMNYETKNPLAKIELSMGPRAWTEGPLVPIDGATKELIKSVYR